MKDIEDIFDYTSDNSTESYEEYEDNEDDFEYTSDYPNESYAENDTECPACLPENR